VISLQQVRDGLARQHDVATCEVCDTGYVLGAVDVLTDLVLVHHGRMHKWLGITYLCHRQIPVLPYDVFKVDESHWHHPIFDWRWVWVEGEYLQLYRVEIVYWDRRLGVGVQIFVQLLQDGMDFEGCLRRRQEQRLFLQISKYMWSLYP
jgi:hypothetical protein